MPLRAHTRPRTAAARSAAEPTAWTSYANDNQLRNSASSESLTRSPSLGWPRPGRRSSTAPSTPPRSHSSVAGRQLLFVATEAGSVYALDAATGEAVWKRDLGTVTTADCGTWGITSTGAIDPTRGAALRDRRDGKPARARPLDRARSRRAIRSRSSTRPHYEYVWGGLRIAGGRVYVPIASYCDVGAPDGLFPEGSLKSLPLDRATGATVWDPVPGPQNLGGIWGWGGISVDPRDGSIFTAVGNSHVHSDACDCFVDDAGYGDNVVHLTADLSSVIDAENPAIPGTGDYDFGAAPVLFQPEGCPPLAAANNKNGTLYVWNRTSLAAGPVAEIPISDGRAAFVGTPAWSAATADDLRGPGRALRRRRAARQRCPCVPGDRGLSVHRSVGGSPGRREPGDSRSSSGTSSSRQAASRVGSSHSTRATGRACGRRRLTVGRSQRRSPSAVRSSAPTRREPSTRFARPRSAARLCCPSEL